jgi:hypothetical protein
MFEDACLPAELAGSNQRLVPILTLSKATDVGGSDALFSVTSDEVRSNIQLITNSQGVPMKRLLPVSALCLGLSVFALQASHADQPAIGAPPEKIDAADSLHPEWKVQFAPVPELLRLHCPMIAPGHGLVVERVGDVKDAPFRLKRGDVLMSVDGMPVLERDGAPKLARLHVLVLRRGQMTPIGNSGQSQFNQSMPRMSQWAFPGRTTASVSTSAFAGSNESVSVSQNGDQVSVSLDLPNLHPAPLRYQGTRDQIEDEVRNSNLAPAVRRRVLEAIDR